MKRFPLAIFLVAVLSVGCRDQELLKPSAPGAPMAVIMDGAHAGNPFFFFLAPLVPNPSSLFHPGAFNARLSPVVEVCELTQDPGLPPNPVIECVAGNPKFGPARMTLDGSAQQYQLNWDTKASQLSAIKFYRITVRGAPRGEPLGFVDVDPVDQGMKNVRTGDVVAFNDDRTLPIRVRIEDGAFGSTNSDDHVEQVVPTSIPTGTLDVTTNTGTAGARFSNGWLPRAAVAAGIDQVVVIIERLTPDNRSDETSCLRSGLEELEGCYRFRTDPDLSAFGAFNVSVIAGVCFEIPADIGNPDGPPFELHRRREVGGVLVGDAVTLVEVPAPFLNCAGFGESQIGMGDALRSGSLADVASAGWNALVRGVGRLVMPSTLHAIDFGGGGSTDFFSRFGYARRASMAVTAGNGAIAAAGSLVNASVHLQNTHHGEITPIAGQAVTYTITAGGGTLVAPDETEVSTLTVPSTEAGNAPVSWRLGAGMNQLRVSTAHVLQTPLFITAAGVALPGYEVVTSDIITLGADGGFARETVQCPAGKVVLGGGSQVVGEGAGNFDTRLRESSPGTSGGGAVSLWLASITNEDASPHNVRIFAVCANPPSGYEVVASSTFPLAAGGGFIQETAVCPTGKVVLGGGAQVVGGGTGNFETRLQESTPGTIGGGALSEWLASIRNEDVTPHTVQVFAVCVNPPFGYQVVTSSNFALAAGGGFIRETAQCPTGKVVLGGGTLVVAEGAGDFDTRLRESGPGTIGGGAQSLWLVSIRNLDTSPHVVRIFAVCAPTADPPAPPIP